MPFLKFCPKSKRAQLISPSYLAEPVQKAYQRVFASMELLKIVLTFYPRESNNYPANSQCVPVKSTLDATFCKLHLKCWINMCPLYTLDIAFRTLKKTAMLQNFRIFRSQVSTYVQNAIPILLFLLRHLFILRKQSLFYISKG